MEQTIDIVLEDGGGPDELVLLTKALLQMPEVRAGLNGDAEKALKPGSKTTGRLKGAQLGIVQHAAEMEIPQAQADFRERFHDHIADWQEAISRYNRQKRQVPLIAQDELQKARNTILRRAQRDIRVGYERLFELGKRKGANLLPIGKDEQHVLTKLRRDEFLFLRNFMDDVQEGKGSMDYDQRADLYGNASIEAAWAGFVAADLSHDRLLRWARSPESETCQDCERLAGERKEQSRDGGRWGDGVYSGHELMRMAIFPGSGRLFCTTNCHCRLVPVRPRQYVVTGRITPFVTSREKPHIREQYERHKPRHALRWRGRKQHAK